jgi:hypothetical protein
LGEAFTTIDGNFVAEHIFVKCPPTPLKKNLIKINFFNNQNEF